MPRTSKRDTQIKIRVSEDVATRLDAIAAHLSTFGVEPTRTNALQAVLTAGLPVLEERFKDESKTKKR